MVVPILFSNSNYFFSCNFIFNHQVTFGVVIAAGNFSTSILSSLLTITTAMTRMQSVQEINKQIIKLQQFNRPSKNLIMKFIQLAPTILVFHLKTERLYITRILK